MRLLHGLDGLRQLSAGSTLSVGNFDGMHLGHRKILSAADELRGRGDDRARLAVITFEPHPLTVLRPDNVPPRLTPAPLKRELLEGVGVDDLVELPPTQEVLNLTAEAFWSILRDQVRPSHVVEGHTFNFGKGRGGTIARLRAWAAASDVHLHVVDPVSVPLLDLTVVAVSSSLVRWLLAHRRVRDAAICLGRSYTLRGEVIKGHQRGRAIGWPTANLDVKEQLIPADGVYVGRTTVSGKTHASGVSIGTMPTFGRNNRQVEAHLIGLNGDLYGQVMNLELIDWSREQIKYGSIDALKEQLARDVAHASVHARRELSQPIARLV